MTIAFSHDLKNSGAAATKRYLDSMFKNSGDVKPDWYPAVFVVPHDMSRRYQKQKFVDKVGHNGAVDQGVHYIKWVIGIHD